MLGDEDLDLKDIFTTYKDHRDSSKGSNIRTDMGNSTVEPGGIE